MNLHTLSTHDRLEIIRVFPLYCQRAFLRKGDISKEELLFIKLFRSDHKDKITVIDSVIGIILEQEDYLKSPLSDTKLANVLSNFFWECKGIIPFEIFSIIDRVFEIDYFYPLSEQKFLTDYFENLCKQLPKNTYSLLKTRIFIRNEIRQRSFEKNEEVHLLIDILEKDIREKNHLIHNEYIPVIESLFISDKEGAVSLKEIEENRVVCVGIPYSNKYPYYDKNEKVLHIDEERKYEVNKSEGDAFILEQLFYGDKELGEEWTYDDLRDEWKKDEEASKLIDHGKDLKRFFPRAVDSLIKRVLAQTREPDFLVTKTHRFKVKIPS